MWGWALYDWANSAFSTTVMAGFFPVFFKKFYSAGADPTVSTAKLGLANTLATLLIALSGPVLGAIADRGAYKKRFLLLFCVLGCVATSALMFPEEGSWGTAALFYVLASLAHASSFAFYDSLLPDIASHDELHAVSALGYSLGYLGGGLLFALNIWMYQSPKTFGLVDGATAIKVSFALVGAWWLIFTLPLMLWVKERAGQSRGTLTDHVRGGFAELRETMAHAREQKMVLLFLIAYFFYNDGVGTTIRMAVDYGLSIGLKDSDLIAALLVVQFIGFPSALLYGMLASRFSAKRSLLVGILIYVGVVILASRMTETNHFFMLAVVIGLVQGGVQSVSRSFFAEMIPRENAGQFFGLFNLVGRFGGLLGPLLMGITAVGLNSPRAGILSLILLFGVGGTLLCFVNSKNAIKEGGFGARV